MFFSIDPSNGVAIYDQIVRRVKFAIADGVLVPGQLLRSVRALAVRLAINPNTIAKRSCSCRTKVWWRLCAVAG
jgi:GntR family transcriptional regulator